MLKTIKSKFIALSLGVIIISIGVPVWILLEQVSQNFHDRSVLMIEATIDLMIEGLNESMMRGDRKNIQTLKKMGWKILIVWECEIEKDFTKIVNNICKKLKIN